jgi:hypothetical protein
VSTIVLALSLTLYLVVLELQVDSSWCIMYNQCAKVLDDHFKLALTGDRVSNYFKKWGKMWGSVVHLDNLVKLYAMRYLHL